MNICDPISQQAITRPEIPAIIDGERTVSYRELDWLVRKTAAHLIDRGVAPGDVVGLCLKDHADHLIALLAVARMGAVVLPMDWRARAEEQARLAAGFDAALVLTDAGAKDVPGSPAISLDEAWQRAIAGAAADRGISRGEDTIFCIGVTSGTTGTPKGLEITHSQYGHRIANNRIWLNRDAPGRYLSVTPLCFGAGRNHCLYQLTVGGTVILHPTLFSAEELVEAVARHRASAIYLVPTVLRWLLALPGDGRLALPGLGVLKAGAATLHGEEKRRLVRRVNPNLYQSYGATMVGTISLLFPNDIAEKAESVGRPTPFSEVEIVNEADKPVGPGTVGRLRCRGPAMACGYYGGGVEGEENFRNGWAYPGELAMMDDDGYLYLKGRASDLIIRGGVNIYPHEIEQVLLAHPDIAEAAVVGSPSREFGEEVTAFVVSQGDIAVREVMAHCRARLTAHKAPRRIIPVEALPKTAAGKVRKRELAARLMDQ